ncbi:hypothetical protein AKO1_007898, partial [Acrasis kona]
KLFNILCLCVLICFVAAQDEVIYKDITGRLHISKEELEIGVRVAVNINGDDRVSYVKADGTFTLYELPAGTHYIDFYSVNYLIPQIRIDISPKTGKYRAFAIIPSTNGQDSYGVTQTPISVVPTLNIKPISKNEYFEREEPFDPFSMLKNPMAITLIVGLGIALLAPKLVDPEQMKELQASMSQSESEMKSMMSGFGLDGNKAVENKNQVNPQVKKKQ